MKTKAIKDFKFGEMFTFTPEYNEKVPVFAFERLTDDGELAVCRDQNECGRFFELDEEYYPIYFSSLDGTPYREDVDEPSAPVWKSECMNTKVDMVEVVRCKYCVLRFTEKCVLQDQAFPINKGANWFCADGKRKPD